jgi:hypothetical protein
VNELVTKTIMDQHVRDNLNFLYNDQPRVRLTRTSNQSMSNNVNTAIVWQAEELDNENMWTAGSPDRIVIARAGVYCFVGQVRWAANAVGQRWAYLLKNGAGSVNASEGSNVSEATGGYEFTQMVHGLVSMAIGDDMRLQVLQDSGASLDVIGTGSFGITGLMVWRHSG